MRKRFNDEGNKDTMHSCCTVYLKTQRQTNRKPDRTRQKQIIEVKGTSASKRALEHDVVPLHF